MKIVRFLQPWMPLYRQVFFENILDLGIQDGIYYEVFSGPPPREFESRGDLIDNSDLYTIVPTKEKSLGDRSLILHHLDNSWLKADLVIAEHAIRNLATFKWSYLHRPKRLALWGHGKTYTKSNTKAEAWLKTTLVNHSDWFFAYTQGGVDSVVAKGFPLERTTVVQNSTDTSELTHMRSKVTPQEVSDFKNSLGLGYGPIGVYIGALYGGKRLPFLVEAANLVKQRIPNFQLAIFGDGPERSFVENATKVNSCVIYGGRADTRILALLSKIADCIMMPGAIGLVAVDSFALGLPIVTTDYQWHGPEFEYLTSGVNSLICKDIIIDYAEATVRLLKDTQRLELMKENCLKNVDQFSIENMAANFHKGVLSALEAPSRRSQSLLRKQ